MTHTVLASLRPFVDSIDGERLTPPATMLALGIAGSGGAPSLFHTPVGTLIAIVVTVAGVRLALLPFGRTGPRPTVYQLLRAALAAVSTAVSRVLSFLGLSAVLTLIMAGFWTGRDDHGGMPYPVLFTTVFSSAMVLIGTLLVMLTLCRLLLLIVRPAPVRVTAPVLDRAAFPAPPTGAAVFVRAGRAVLDDRPRVTAAGALDWLGDDPGPRAAAQQILRALTPPEDRR